MMRRWMAFGIIALLLVGCGGNTATTPPPTVEATPEATAEEMIATAFQPFMATINTPAERKVIIGPGYFQCLDALPTDDNADIARFAYQEIAIDLRAEDAISFILPTNIGLGTYDLNSPSNTPVGLDFTAQIVLAPSAVYDQDIRGTLTIEALPKAAGEIAQGSFAFTASNGSETVEAVGSFNFIAGEDSAYCAPIDSAP